MSGPRNRAAAGRQRVHLTVSGRVQGVFFRQGVFDRARREGVAGWVANRPDGTVEAVFEGEAEAVERLVRFCLQGPRGARVEGVRRWPDERWEGLSGFRVL